MTIAIIAPTNQMRVEKGPTIRAIRDGMTKMSAPIADPTTRLVVSNVFSCRRRETFRLNRVILVLARG